jgi:pyruvate,water dikinase
VLNERSGTHTRWTTVNMAEVLPGVLTPLGYTFWRDPAETGLRAAFADAGVLARSEILPPESVDRRLTAVFHGRYAGNLTFICELCDQTPGSSGARFEEQMFGYADPAVERTRSFRRYPIVAVKMPTNIARLPRRLADTRACIDAWWRRASTARPGSPDERLRQARSHLRDALRIHMFCSLVAQGCYEQVAALARAAGRPGLELELMTGYGGMEEMKVARDLWEVSRERLALEVFLARHGYHGPSEGQLASRSWREDPAPILELLRSYRSRAESENPVLRQRERAETRAAAERTLLERLPAYRRPAARLTLRAAASFLPRREVGKAAFLQAIDGGRAAAREIGARLADTGVLADADDVFFLTIDELDAPPPDARGRVAERRGEHDGYRVTRLPERWSGQAVVEAVGEGAVGDGTLTGVPVSGGSVEGRARVILDPSQAGAFEPGDILVCETTDPSWVVFFQLAAAVVIDVGGPLSHGAIVARELGIPAVINTRTGTHTIPDGAHIRVDGSAGHVEILDHDRSSHAA